MEVKEIILLMLTNSVITTGVVAIVGFIGKSFIEQWINRDLEKYKLELQKAHDKEIEDYKSNIEKNKFMYETSYARFTLKRVELLETLYKLLIIYSRELNGILSYLKRAQSVTTSLESLKSDGLYYELSEEQKESFIKNYENAWNFYCENQIYLSEDLSKRVRKQIMYGYYCMLAIYSTADIEDDKLFMDAWLFEILEKFKQDDPLEIAQDMSKDFNDMLKDLEKEFRSLLSVKE